MSASAFIPGFEPHAGDGKLQKFQWAEFMVKQALNLLAVIASRNDLTN
jgi:hypothetical protein